MTYRPLIAQLLDSPSLQTAIRDSLSHPSRATAKATHNALNKVQALESAIQSQQLLIQNIASEISQLNEHVRELRHSISQQQAFNEKTRALIESLEDEIFDDEDAPPMSASDVMALIHQEFIPLKDTLTYRQQTPYSAYFDRIFQTNSPPYAYKTIQDLLKDIDRQNRPRDYDLKQNIMSALRNLDYLF